MTTNVSGETGRAAALAGDDRAAAAMSELCRKLGVPDRPPTAEESAAVETQFARWGREAKQGWVQDGRLVTGAVLAQRWGVPEAALVESCADRRLFSVEVEGQCLYPAVFLDRYPDEVAAITRAMGAADATSMAIFWWGKHGGLRGLPLHEALNAGVPLAAVLHATTAWASQAGFSGSGLE